MAGDQGGARLAVVVTSNAYKDRQQEIVHEDAWRKYIERVWKDDTFTGDNPLLFWHAGDPIGDIIYSDMVGAFLVEVARERPDQQINLAAKGREPVFSTVKAVWDMLQQSDAEWGASPEFVFFERDREDGEYEQVSKIETSVVPRKHAANAYTFFSVIGE